MGNKDTVPKTFLLVTFYAHYVLPKERATFPSMTTIVQPDTNGSVRDLTVKQTGNSCPSAPATHTEAHAPSPILDEVGSAKDIGNLESVNFTRALSSRQVRAPRLKELIRLIEQMQSGQYEHRDDETLIKKELRAYEYRHLLRIVQNPKERELRNYFETKLRYDYLPSRSLFVIHIPTPVHEHITRRLDLLVGGWFMSLEVRRRGSKDLFEAARSMVFQGSANIPLLGIGTKQPDNSYRHIQCKLPGLVIKIAWSEPVSHLWESAEAFIDETQGGVRTFIGINLNEVYQARKRNETGDAKVFIWRAKFDSSGRYSGIEKNGDKVFQNRAGRAVSSTTLEITFNDFLSKKMADKLSTNNPKLKISAKQLSEIFKVGLAALQEPTDEESQNDESQDIPPTTPDSPSRRIIERFRDSIRRSSRLQGYAAGPGIP
ncbi:hypothetical protein F4859DRAFT_530013 [Xylaria cf. heliscus]|nr:hypothetical protein F4859DRAFT_530013 [Xylaria cf. heliscus]